MTARAGAFFLSPPIAHILLMLHVWLSNFVLSCCIITSPPFLILLHIILRRERLRFGLQRRIPPTSFTVHLQAVRLIVGTSTGAARQFSPKFPSPE